MKKRKLPKYSHHKATGQAYVRLNGRVQYLGLHNSPESHERYAEVVDQWRRESESVPAKDITIGALSVLYLKHAERYYRKRGQVTSEVSAIQIALRHLTKLFRRKPANQFAPFELKLVRQSMIDASYVRQSINRHIGRIIRMFRWAGAEELAAKHVYHDLKMLDGLKRGRSDAVEATPVRPVPLAHINAVEDIVTRPIWGMIQLQLATGMHPGEVMAIRGCDLNMQGSVWEYAPESHKTEHHG